MSDRHESSKELEHELDRQRSEIAHTADELKDRLSPDTLIERGVEYLRGSGGERLMRAARENPLALLVTGAGLAWLLQTASRPPRRVEVVERKIAVPARTPSVRTRETTTTTSSAAPLSAAASAGIGSGTSATTGASRPGVMGDGTEEQNLGQTGNPGARITEGEVKDAFGGDRSSTTPGTGPTPKPGSSAGWPNPT
jgi:hypothetical protein